MFNIIQHSGNTSTITAAIVPQTFTTDLCEQWITYLDVKPKTLETYTRSIRQFVQFLHDNGITTPTRDDVLAFRDNVKATHKPATTNLYITSVKLFFAWLEQEGIYTNIARHVKGCKLDNSTHRKDYLTAGQAKNILSDIDTSTLTGQRDYAIMVLMLTTGLRDCEVMRANFGDLRTLGESVVLYIQGKGHDAKDAYVKITEPAEKAIRAYITARGKTADGDPLFAAHSNRNKGGRMTTRSISRLVKNALRASGYDSDRLTAHSLRHTAATLSLLNGATLRETQQLLRHTSVNTTLIYSHELDRAANTAESRITGALFG